MTTIDDEFVCIDYPFFYVIRTAEGDHIGPFTRDTEAEQWLAWKGITGATIVTVQQCWDFEELP